MVSSLLFLFFYSSLSSYRQRPPVRVHHKHRFLFSRSFLTRSRFIDGEAFAITDKIYYGADVHEQ